MLEKIKLPDLAAALLCCLLGLILLLGGCRTSRHAVETFAESSDVSMAVAKDSVAGEIRTAAEFRSESRDTVAESTMANAHGEIEIRRDPSGLPVGILWKTQIDVSRYLAAAAQETSTMSASRQSSAVAVSEKDEVSKSSTSAKNVEKDVSQDGFGSGLLKIAVGLLLLITLLGTLIYVIKNKIPWK